MAEARWAAVGFLLVLASGAEAGAAGPGKAAAWGPADVCAIAARPEAPGHDEIGGSRESARAAAAVRRAAEWQTGFWDPKWKARPEWGPCPVDRVRFDELHFSPDGRFARTLGGWQAGMLAGAWGYCLFEKRKKRWDVLVCEISAVS